MSLVLRDVEVEGRRVDVRLEGGVVGAVGTDLAGARDDVVEGHGGALIPGLHDHHLHLLAMAAARRSVPCGPPDVTTIEELAEALGHGVHGSHGSGWVRGVGYHESVAGDLDRHVLDRIVPDRPVRIQHRGGALWMLNTAALTVVAPVLDDSDDVERDAQGEPTGRLWRYDERLRPGLPEVAPDLDGVATQLIGLGITSVTDATPDLSPSAVRTLATFPLAVTLLGAPDEGSLPGRTARGPRKLLLRDHDLPTYDELCGLIGAAHATGRPVAVHCVSRESLILTLAALQAVGPAPGDRLEHASVVPVEVIPQLAALGVSVVTQPDFLRTRGDDYLRDVAADDIECLYRHQSLLDAGVPVTCSSDAPFGTIDPWQVVRSAVQRRTRGGIVMGPDEVVGPEQALAGYLSASPGGPRRRIAPGTRADLCLLRLPLADALRNPSSDLVGAVVVDGRLHVPSGTSGPDARG